MRDIVDRLRIAETAPLDADGKVSLFIVLGDAIAEITRLREERRGWLTAEEREGVEECVSSIRQEISLLELWQPDHRWLDQLRQKDAVLSGLLARSTPPRVKVPHLDDLEADERPVWQSACEAWIAAIRDAGGEVEG